MGNAKCHTFMAVAIRPLVAACWLTCGWAAASQEDTAQAPAVSGDECEITVSAAPLPFRQFDNVEIAGVAITDPQSKLAQPLLVICHRQVERSPATYPGELLQFLPALMPSRSISLSGSLDIAAVHGNPAGTLVLLNGQRLPRTGPAGWQGGGDAVDLRFLPMSAIDRVEVQTPGASSAMGPDGISGAVNILTRKTRGLSIDVETLIPTRGQGAGQGLNLAWGYGSLRTNGYALQLHAALKHDNAVLISPVQPTMRVAPANTRHQLFLEGERAVGAQWSLFGHLLGTQETPSSSLTSATRGWFAPVLAQSPWPLTHNHQQDMHQWRIGLKGPWQQWDVQASASSGQARQQQHMQAGITDFSLLEPSLQKRQESLQDLLALAPQAHDTRLHTLSAHAQRELDSLLEGPRTLGLGWQWRQESLATRLGSSAANDWQGQRQQWSVYAEFKTPVAEHQEWTVALRHEQHAQTGGVQTGELAWKWRPDTSFLMRASLGTGYRAPGLDQLSPHIARSWLIWDPTQASELRVQRRGQAELDAEQSTHASWGFRLEPHPRWTLGADLWHLNVRQAIGYSGPAALRAAGQLLSDAQGPYLDSAASNLGRSSQQGIDYDTEWRVPGDAGLLRLSLRGSLYLKSMLTEAASGRHVSDLAQVSDITQNVTPRHKVVAGASLEQGNWVLMGGWRYRSGYREALLWPLAADPANALGARQVPAHWRLDVGAQWAPSRQWTLSAWLQDATDRGRANALVNANILHGVELIRLEDVGRSLKLRAHYRF